jgi:nucleoid DNA-binding protein
MANKLRDLPICNQKCLEHAAKLCKEDKKMVTDTVNHLFQFTLATLSAAEADSIQLPFFGKFRVKNFKSKIKQNAKSI